MVVKGVMLLHTCSNYVLNTSVRHNSVQKPEKDIKARLNPVYEGAFIWLIFKGSIDLFLAAMFDVS